MVLYCSAPIERDRYSWKQKNVKFVRHSRTGTVVEGEVEFVPTPAAPHSPQKVNH